MRRIRFIYTLVVVLFAPRYLTAQAAAAVPTAPIALRVARMLDVKCGTVIANATVRVKETRIVAGGANVSVPPEAKDLQRVRFVMPAGQIVRREPRAAK
ncbi:MAG: hypothetical protein ABJF01_16225 [bacterium]